MDIASLIGLIGTLGMIAGAMISSGGLGMFIDTPSMLIVIGGTFFCSYVQINFTHIPFIFWDLSKSFYAGRKKT